MCHNPAPDRHQREHRDCSSARTQPERAHFWVVLRVCPVCHTGCAQHIDVRDLGFESVLGLGAGLLEVALGLTDSAFGLEAAVTQTHDGASSSGVFADADAPGVRTIQRRDAGQGITLAGPRGQWPNGCRQFLDGILSGRGGRGGRAGRYAGRQPAAG